MTPRPICRSTGRYLSSILGPTYPNRFYTHAAATDRISNQYYVSDVPFLALWGQKYLNISSPIGKFLAQAETGQPFLSLVAKAGWSR